MVVLKILCYSVLGKSVNSSWEENLSGNYLLARNTLFLYIYLNYNFLFPLSEKACAEAGSARMSLLILVSIFLSAAFVMFLVYKNFPQLSE
jgi:hypothetical protein